jgi:hypothetical protein
MTKAKPSPKFKGELAKPILAPLPDGGDLLSDGVLMTRIRRMGLLAEHYGVEPGDFFLLAYKMACDFVPGLQVLYDDMRARAMRLPDAYYCAGTKKKGSGSIPEFMDGDVLIWVFSLYKQKFPKENDIAIADRIVLTLDAELAGAAHEAKRDRLSKTLRNRLAVARHSNPIS